MHLPFEVTDLDEGGQGAVPARGSDLVRPLTQLRWDGRVAQEPI